MIESDLPQPDAPLTAASIEDALQAGRATLADVKKALKHAVPVPTELPGEGSSTPPKYISFNDWCVRTSLKEKRALTVSFYFHRNRLTISEPGKSGILSKRQKADVPIAVR